MVTPKPNTDSFDRLLKVINDRTKKLKERLEAEQSCSATNAVNTEEDIEDITEVENLEVTVKKKEHNIFLRMASIFILGTVSLVWVVIPYIPNMYAVITVIIENLLDHSFGEGADLQHYVNIIKL